MNSKFFLLTALFLLACSASTVAQGELSASTVQNTPPTEKSERADAVYALGTIRIRSACGAGLVEPPCNNADLGSVEAGTALITAGVIEVSNHPDCQQWQPVKWGGGVGYICALWIR